jgi:hypothetical protein
MSLLDMDEKLVQLLDLVKITSSPIADLKHPPEGGVVVGILSARSIIPPTWRWPR